jgi:hypothetical protein
MVPQSLFLVPFVFMLMQYCQHHVVTNYITTTTVNDSDTDKSDITIYLSAKSTIQKDMEILPLKP